MNRLLMSIVLDALAFLELSGEEVVDPDAAVGLTESISATLKALAPADRMEFLEFVEAQARAAAMRSDERVSQFLHSLPEALGLS
jgi:hypothetical protein